MRTQKGGVARFTEVGQSSKQQKTMEVAELSALSSSKASDFEIQHVLGSGQNGLVVAAKCLREGLPNPDKLYAVKLLFNFTHEYSSVVRNAYENEWLILSRLLPHENIIRFWAQFISPIPDSFAKLLSPETRKHCTRKNRSGQVMATKGQFLVLDYHPYDLETWILKLPQPTEFDDLLKFVEQILEGVLYLEKNSIRHLDLKMSNILVTEDEKIVLCDFGCAVQLSDRSLTLPLTRGMLPGGNRAHLAPEILNTHHSYKRNPTRRFVLNYSKQTSFAVGALIYEMALREHPLVDYPLGYTNNELVSYAAKDLLPLPASYPKSFCSIVSDMLNPDTSKRLSIEEALNQLRVCCIKKKSRESMTSLQVDLDRVKRERELAKVRMNVVYFWDLHISGTYHLNLLFHLQSSLNSLLSNNC